MGRDEQEAAVPVPEVPGPGVSARLQSRRLLPRHRLLVVVRVQGERGAGGEAGRRGERSFHQEGGRQRD